MKIFFIITNSKIGGAQTHVYQLAKYFIEKGNTVALMSYPGGWLEKEFKELGGIFYPNKYLTSSITPIKDLKAIKEIKRAVADFQPQIVASHSTKAGFLTRIAIRNKIPTIFTAHGWAFSEGTPFWRKIFVPVLEKIASFYCEKIICVSKFTRKLALRYRIAPPKKLTVIYNGIELPPQDIQKDIDKKIKIVYVGRLYPQKKPELLIEAFAILPSSLKEKSEVYIIGEGPKRKKLQRMIQKNGLEDKIKIFGGLPREKTFEILKDSHIFVLPAAWEGFPYAILEAMSFGMAIVATDVGGVREAIEDCGILIKNKKIELAKILEKLIQNPFLIQTLGKKAREKVEKNFLIEKMLKETERVYQEVLS